MAQIGAVTVDTLEGEIDTLKSRFQDITRPRVDGTAVRENAKRADVSTLQTTKLMAAADYAATKTSYHELIGTLVTVTKDDGLTYSNCLILRVNVLRQPVANSTVPLADTMARAVWQVRDTNTV